MPRPQEQVRNYIREQSMPPTGTRVIVALSGGADSVALLLILKELGYEVAAAHCNFGLREEAVVEEEFVRKLCERLQVPLRIRRFTTADFDAGRGEGIQQTARKLRYAFFEEWMAERAIPYCATGHHADDDTETLLMSFFRGNGPVLLQGIPSKRGPYFRPLLCLSKAEITAWLQAQDQPWCHDRSNDANDYQRNLIRNELIPILERLQPGFRERFRSKGHRHHAQLAVLSAVFQPLAAKVVHEAGGEQWISLSEFRTHMDEAHFPAFLDWWLGDQRFSGTEIHEIQRLLQAATGAIYRGRERQVLRDRDGLRFKPHESVENTSEVEIVEVTEAGQSVEFAGQFLYFQCRSCPAMMNREKHEFSGVNTVEMHWMDGQQVKFPLKIRRWHQGDTMKPFGLKGSKKISDILIDQKRNQFSKATAWLLEDQEGIILLGGYRIADRVALRHTTTHCLYIEVRQV